MHFQEHVSHLSGEYVEYKCGKKHHVFVFVPSFMGNPLVILLTANQLEACFKTTLKKVFYKEKNDNVDHWLHRFILDFGAVLNTHVL